MSLAHNDFLPPTSTFLLDGAAARSARPALQGEAACVQAFQLLAARDAASWQMLPVCGGATTPAFAPVLHAALCGDADGFPYVAIAAEAQRPFARGLRGATPLALLLLAGVALGRIGAGDGAGDGAADEDADGARTLARAALDIAARLGPAAERQARLLHAALVAPCTGAFEASLAELAALCEDDTAPHFWHLQLAGNGFMAGMPLRELARCLARASRSAARPAPSPALAGEIAARASLVDGLLRHAPGAAVPVTDAAADAPQPARFGFWLARLQAAVYGGDDAAARHAATRAEPLVGPLLGAGDRLAWHLFGALAWMRAAGDSAAAWLDTHCEALHRLARRLPASTAAATVAACAEAARASHGGDALAALRGFEGAAAGASREGRHGLAGLAWEQAACQAEACGLGTATRHYRREALASYERWGAAGRAAALRQAWGEDAGDARDAGDAQACQAQAGRVGELGLSIAHEVNQPLAAISLHAAAARRWLNRSEPNIERALSSLSLISAAGQHAGDIVRSVQRLVSHGEPDMDSVVVDQAIGDTLRLLHRPLRKHGIAVDLALELGDCAIVASRVQLQQVLTNLLVNATEALAAGPDAVQRRIRIASRRQGEAEIEIAVSDNGPGIPPELAGRVFGSLFSTKPNSTGMGLSISLAIVRAHGGRIAYEPCQPHGACFRLRLPVQSGQP